MAAKIRRDDEVVVISGKDRGKTGRVLRVDPGSPRSTWRV
jgi:large subunit ribosomal protein L24